MKNPIADNLTPGNILNFKPKTKALAASSETSLFNKTTAIAVVTEVNGTQPVSVTLNDTRYPVTHYLSTLSGIAPSVKLGDQVLISAIAGEDGVMIHGIMMLYTDKPSRSSISMQDDKLVIEAQGAVVLKCGRSTIELNEAGEIRIDGKDVRTVASDTLTLLGGNVNLN